MSGQGRIVMPGGQPAAAGVGFMLPAMLPLDLCEICATFGEARIGVTNAHRPAEPPGKGWMLVEWRIGPTDDGSGPLGCYLWARPKQARGGPEA